MTLAQSIGCYAVRKSLRFELKPVAGTADHLEDVIADNEDRAAGLNFVKDMISTRHDSMVRRVFDSLPDPLPDNPETIKRAFRLDPEYKTLNDPNAYNLLKDIIERCRYNKWTVPKSLRDLHGWSALYMKWHWHCITERSLSGSSSIVSGWAGRSKSDILATSRHLRKPRKHDGARGRWYEHAPFRMLFDNQGCGMSWLKEDFAASRNFLLVDGDRILVGIIPRKSKVNPYTMPRPLPLEQRYMLYEETAGAPPSFRAIPRALVDAAAYRGTVYLFEFTGRGLRSKSNLNAMYLRALFSAANLDCRTLHLDRSCEFHYRRASIFSKDMPHEHFRQRFTENKFFITVHITFNANLVSRSCNPSAFRKVKKILGINPYAKFIRVIPAQGGYSVVPHTSAEKAGIADSFVSTRDAANGKLAALLAKLVTEKDVHVVFDKSMPEKIKKAIADKFSYVVIKGVEPFSDGGVLRGYQLTDRLFTGTLPVVAEPSTDVPSKCVPQAQPVCNTSDTTRTPANQTFTYTYMTSDRVRHNGTIDAPSKQDAYDMLKKTGIRPIRVLAEGEAPPPVKKFYPEDKQHVKTQSAPPSSVVEPSSLPPARSVTQSATASTTKAELSIAERLKRLNALKSDGLLTEDEYTAQRAKIISEL